MRRVTFKKYAGVKIAGKKVQGLDSDHSGTVDHSERASWLTAKVESGGKYGSVMCYDGTGMTAGIHQAVAVFPRDLKSQGTLFALLGHIRTAVETIAPVGTPGSAADCWIELQDAFMDAGAVLTDDSVLREYVTKRKLTGGEIRKVLTGDTYGAMPVRGPGRERCEKFAQLFHDLFSCPETFRAQDLYGLRHFAKMSRRKEFGGKSLDEIVYGQDLLAVEDGDIQDELDLAMCFYWSYTVNAPGIARKLMKKVLSKKYRKPIDMARTIVATLGNSKFGRWDDDLKNGRYQRTRKYAMELFGKNHDMFKSGGIMPADLEG